MTPAERLILYSAQRIADEGGDPTKTKILKVIYLMDVEYYRHRGRTLTSWPWVFYKYGPYVFEFDDILGRLGLHMEEIEGRTPVGKQFYSYRVPEEQSIDDLFTNFADRVRVDEIINLWATQPLNLLLNYVYFHTEPMQNAVRLRPLNFSVIQPRFHEPQADTAEVSLPKARVEALRLKLAAARERAAEDKAATKEAVKAHPFSIDGDYMRAMARIEQEMNNDLPEGERVLASQE